LQYLVDADVVDILRRLQSALSENGIIVLKENRPLVSTVGVEGLFQVDTPGGPHSRYDVCRPDLHHRWLFRCAGLAVESAEDHGEVTAWVLRPAGKSFDLSQLVQPTVDIGVATDLLARYGNAAVVPVGKETEAALPEKGRSS
jgi:hypothetical protein